VDSVVESIVDWRIRISELGHQLTAPEALAGEP
jgi:hypothetical protein